jgi:hypothetical protein
MKHYPKLVEVVVVLLVVVFLTNGCTMTRERVMYTQMLTRTLLIKPLLTLT